MCHWRCWSSEKTKENETAAKKVQEETSAVAEDEHDKGDARDAQKYQDDFTATVAAADPKMEM